MRSRAVAMERAEKSKKTQEPKPAATLYAPATLLHSPNGPSCAPGGCARGVQHRGQGSPRAHLLLTNLLSHGVV